MLPYVVSTNLRGSINNAVINRSDRAEQNIDSNIDFYSKKLKCLSKDVELYGDYNSDKARVLKLTYERCNNSTIEAGSTCHTDEEITNFIRRKFIMTL